MDTFFATLFVLICVLLIIVVLLQKGRGGGLGAALGGTASSAFGTRTGDVFTWVTIVLTALFLLLAIGTTVAFRPLQLPSSPPAFDPELVAIAKPIDVRIDVPGDQSKSKSKIYYTTDGSEPTEASAQYQKRPVKVEPGTWLKAVARRGGRKLSSVKAFYYGRPEDAQAPATGPASTTAPSVTAPPAAVPASRPATLPAGG